MTTIESDSESQDSDDGRRFRFEATRKDDALRLPSHDKRRSPLSRRSVHGPRSKEEGHHRRSNDKSGGGGGGRQDRERREGNDHGKRRESRDRDSKDRHEKGGGKESSRGKGSDGDSKNPVEPEKRSSDSKNSSRGDSKDSQKSREQRNSKDSRWRDSKGVNPRDSKDPKAKDVRETRDVDQRKEREGTGKNSREREIRTSKESETKDHRERDRSLKRSRDPSRERTSAATERKRIRSRGNYKNRGRSRERVENKDGKATTEPDKPKEEKEKPKVEEPKGPPVASKSRNRKRKRGAKRRNRSPSKILDQLGTDSESDLGALDPDAGPVMSLDALEEDCTEMNLSDFDVVSDTEGSSSESSQARPATKGPIIKGAILPPHYYEPNRKKRVSRRHYERLVRNQAVMNKRRLEQLCKVNDDGSATTLGSSDNNPSAVSDFLLGPGASVSAATERRGSRVTDEDASSQHRTRDSSSITNTKTKSHRPIESLPFIKSNDDDDPRRTGSSVSESNDERSYGPMLPPSRSNISEKSSRSDNSDQASQNILDNEHSPVTDLAIGPRLPPLVAPIEFPVIGPTLPPHLKGQSDDQSTYRVGPSLPPDFTTTVIGPSLPPHLRQNNASPTPMGAKDSPDPEVRRVLGPQLPQHLEMGDHLGQMNAEDSESDEGDVVGPLPPDHPAALGNYVQRQLDERAKRMKDKLTAENERVDKREEWMLELPSAKNASLGLSARQFRSKAGPDMSDRSSWTDTPADKARKREERLAGKNQAADLTTESERLAVEQRDEAMEQMVSKHQSKKRQESLVEQHQKKLRKKKKKEEKEAKEAAKSTRRPFDRDIDLQANRFDDAQKKSILKKAQLLNDRFSRGQSKYL